MSSDDIFKLFFLTDEEIIEQLSITSRKYFLQHEHKDKDIAIVAEGIRRILKLLIKTNGDKNGKS